MDQFIVEGACTQAHLPSRGTAMALSVAIRQGYVNEHSQP